MGDEKSANFVKDTVKAFGDITASYTTLVDLGKEYAFGGILISSSLDEPVKIKFANALSDELEIAPGSALSLDSFTHYGVIQIKYSSSAPTAGAFKMINWRTE